MVSTGADTILTLRRYVRTWLRHWFGTPPPPEEMAQARPIDLSIQFLLFWLPLLIILGWLIKRPMHLMFGKSPCRFKGRDAVDTRRFPQITMNLPSFWVHAFSSTTSLPTGRPIGQKGYSWLGCIQ